MLNAETRGVDYVAEAGTGEPGDDPKPSEAQQPGHDVCRRGVRMTERRNARNASWAKDPAHLGEGSRGTGKQVQDVRGHDRIELAVPERERQGIGLADLAVRHPRVGHARTEDLQHGLARVGRHEVIDNPRNRLRDEAGARSDLQHVGGTLHKLRDTPHHLVEAAVQEVRDPVVPIRVALPERARGLCPS